MGSSILSVALVVIQAVAPQPPAGLDVRALSTVYVHDDRGAETKGKLVRLDEQAVLVLVDGQERRFELAHVTRIQKRGDSLRNGAITGAVLGVLLGGLSGGMADCKQSDGGWGACGVGSRIGMALVGAGVYGAIGAGIDAAIAGRTTLYQRPIVSAGVAAKARGAAVRLHVTW